MAENREIIKLLQEGRKAGRKMLAVLIDPDKAESESILNRIDLAIDNSIDFILVGGSLMTSDKLEQTLNIVKQNCNIPVVLFPGSVMQISSKADGILLLSLISGRNPELLIGNHVLAAPVLKESGLEILSTGYMLVESGNNTTASYISNTIPIPRDKGDIAACTAMAGEMLGLQLMYLDAGSGAEYPVSGQMIEAVRKSIELPLIVGGGITDAMKVKKAFQSGADLVVIGNAIEKNPSMIAEAAESRNEFSGQGIQAN